jgi:hypothetical protein
MRFHCLFLLLAAVFIVPALQAQTPEGVVVTAKSFGPSVDEIVQRAVANDELRRAHRSRLECDQIITTERLDDSGQVFKTKTVRIIHRETSDLAGSAAADISAAGSAANKDGDTVKAQHRMHEMDLRKLAPRFQYTLAADAPVRGRTCYVIEYSPRPGQVSGTGEEKVIDQLHGRYWIDKKTFEILQGEGSLAVPASVGLFASVAQMSFVFHTQTLPNGEAGPADFAVDFTVKAPFYFYRQRQMNRLENWRVVRK